METQFKPGILFKFRRPAGALMKPPSRAMTEALERLSQSNEMQEFIARAQAQNRAVVLEVFHAREGHPLLIHTAAVTKKA